MLNYINCDDVNSRCVTLHCNTHNFGASFGAYPPQALPTNDKRSIDEENDSILIQHVKNNNSGVWMAGSARFVKSQDQSLT